MKKIIGFILIIHILFTSYVISGAAPVTQGLNLNAPSYILIDPITGQVLYEQQADAIMYPASTTKIMTAILTIEHGDLDKKVTATQSNIDPGNGGSNIGIMAGEELYVRDLLNAMLVKSANETANILAESVCATRQEFVDLMNKRAAELGATNTHFVTTNGMHDDNHYTTVRDMSKMARYAMTLPLFREIVKKTKYQMPITNKHDHWDTLYTTNQLKTDPYFKSELYSEVTGVKTGYTGEAGNNLVSAAVNDEGMELLAVVYGVKKSPSKNEGVFGISKSLLEYGFKNYSRQKVIGSGEVMKSVTVKNAKEKTDLNLITSGELVSVLPKDTTQWNLEKNIHFTSDTYTAPIKKNQVAGTIEYKRNGVSLGTVNIIAAQEVKGKPAATLLNIASQVLGNKVIKSILTSILIVLASFFLLRRILRKASRFVRARRREG